jgi:type IX secretion system PorP/SprF family membrane protein
MNKHIITLNMKRVLLGVASLSFATTLSAQDVHFSQQAYSPLTLNPALAGANHDLQAIVNYRSQWNSVAEPFQTIAASFDMRLNPNKRDKKGHFAMGLNFFNDRAGAARMTTNNINLNVAYHVILDDGHTLGGGGYVGWGQRSIDPGAGKWGSQYNGTTYDQNINSGEVFGSNTFSMFDAGAGLVYTYSAAEQYMSANNSTRINAGFAVYHLNRPSYSFLNKQDESLYMRFSGFANAAFGIGNSNFIIEPGVYYQQQGTAREIFLGTYGRYILQEGSKITGNLERTSVALGAFYRFGDAFIAKALFEWSGLGVGFAYDFNLSSLTSVSRARGGFELFLRWVMPSPMSATRTRI